MKSKCYNFSKRPNLNTALSKCTFFALVFFALTINSLSVSAQIRLLNAERIDKAPKIDAELDEAMWLNAMPGSEFTEFSPNPNTASDQKTIVKVLYDDKAVYVSATMIDNSGAVKKELGVRDDDVVNADRFEIYLDAFMSGQNAYKFGVTASGVQLDSRITPVGEEIAWDAVWEVDTKINDNGWVAEFRIPYSAFRFPRRDFQTWGVNFKRVIRSTREHSYWNPVMPEIDGFVNQFGVIQGMGKIKPPVRFSLTPFFVSNFRHTPQDSRDAQAWDTKVSGGLDWKYGFNETYTLDMTIIPDFGQVQFDDVVLNLSPYEQRFDENRPFFTEGIDLFQRGGDLFYTRRVGGEPLLYNAIEADAKLPDNERQILESQEVLVDNPVRSRLLNAFKFSGRNRNGLGVGIFNGISGATFAKVEKGVGSGIFREIVSNTPTNYNVIVVDQLFANNSYVSFINTNVVRKQFEGNPEQLNQTKGDANVTGTEFRYATKNNQYAVTGRGLISQLFLTDENNDPTGRSGFAYGLGFGKIGGNFRWNINRDTKSDTYDQTDAGFLANNNLTTNSATAEYKVFKPFGAFNNLNSYVRVNHNQLFEPNSFASFTVEGGIYTTMKNFLTLGVETVSSPLTSYDYFEPRVEGYKFNVPSNARISGFASSDYRKAVALDVNAGYRIHSEWGRKQFDLMVSPRFRLSNRFSLIPRIEYVKIKQDQGFVAFSPGTTDVPVFGIRDRDEIIPSLTANFLFSKKMSVSLRGRYYLANVDYQDTFKELNTDGTLGRNVDVGEQDMSFKALNLDLIYRFRFAPGSEINLIWKQSALNERSGTDPFPENPAENLFSIKILYYLDYLKIKRSSRDQE